jgi:cyclopropane fatty-acyl-phospholipid synthase-like methyltransferase
MNPIIYRLMYRLTRPGWDTGITPPEVVAAFAEGDIPPGAALDLGCGTGTNVIYMAQQGRPAMGVDFVPRAIAMAIEKARQAGVAAQTRFQVGDVTHLPELGFPACGFALDMGCFHGLSLEQQGRYAAGLAAQLAPGGRFMLYAADPLTEGFVRFGSSREQVERVFSPRFAITRAERGKFGRGASTWYWMSLKH